MFGQELLVAFVRLEELLERYPVRGLKGAVGTQLDQLELLDGDADRLIVVDEKGRVVDGDHLHGGRRAHFSPSFNSGNAAGTREISTSD